MSGIIQCAAGTSLRLRDQFHDDTGTAADPSSPTCRHETPAGTFEDLSAPAKVDSKTGYYGVTIDTTGWAAGLHNVRIAGTVATAKAVATNYSIYIGPDAPANNALLASGTYGLAALKTLIDALPTAAAIATAVWGAGTRTLTAFGTLVSDIWANASRTLSDKTGFSLTSAYDPAKTALQPGGSVVASNMVDAPDNAGIAAVAAAVAALPTGSDVQTATAAALAAYDPPTRAEATADKDEILAAMPESSGATTSLTTGGIPGKVRITFDVGTTGLAPGFEIYNANGTVHAARSTTGVTELPAGSGVYGVELRGDVLAGRTVVWDTGESTPRYGSESFPMSVAVAGSGSVTWAYTLTRSDTGAPIVGATVWVTSDEAGTAILASGVTDSDGVVTFFLDPGTVYVWRLAAGYVFANPDAEVVA